MRRAISLLLGALVLVIAASAKDPPRPDVRTRLAQGVTYSFSFEKKGRWAVHTLTADLTDGVFLELGKGLEHMSGLERVHDIMHRFDSVHAGNFDALGGVNANFWRAGSNHPMGPTVIDGIVLTGEQHNNWSSIAVADDNSVYIDRFTMHSELLTRFGAIEIGSFNRRRDSLSLVAYTEYFGGTVPFIDTARIFRASADTITDDSESDSIAIAAVDSVYSISPESGTVKIQFRYLEHPRANTRIPCEIVGIDTGIVEIPRGGGVLSFGRGRFPLFFSLFVGDTFSIATRTIPELPVPIRMMTGGTPRLVRNGHVSVEWQEEGLRKRRFVTGRYARTAFGISRDGRRVILVTVEPTNRRAGRRGIGLTDLAKLMIARGAWQSINFDGGGSATMVVGDQTVAPPTGTRYSRKISTALMVVQPRSRRDDTGSGGTR